MPTPPHSVAGIEVETYYPCGMAWIPANCGGRIPHDEGRGAGGEVKRRASTAGLLYFAEAFLPI